MNREPLTKEKLRGYGRDRYGAANTEDNGNKINAANQPEDWEHDEHIDNLYLAYGGNKELGLVYEDAHSLYGHDTSSAESPVSSVAVASDKTGVVSDSLEQTGISNSHSSSGATETEQKGVAEEDRHQIGQPLVNVGDSRKDGNSYLSETALIKEAKASVALDGGTNEYVPPSSGEKDGIRKDEVKKMTSSLTINRGVSSEGENNAKR